MLIFRYFSKINFAILLFRRIANSTERVMTVILCGAEHTHLLRNSRYKYNTFCVQ